MCLPSYFIIYASAIFTSRKKQLEIVWSFLYYLFAGVNTFIFAEIQHYNDHKYQSMGYLVQNLSSFNTIILN